MALFPCSSCGVRYPGRALHAYLALTLGRDSDREHYRLCPQCFETLHQVLDNVLQDAQVPLEGDRDPQCPVCARPLQRGEESCALYVTAYAADDARVDYWSPLHRACRSGLALGALEPLLLALQGP